MGEMFILYPLSASIQHNRIEKFTRNGESILGLGSKLEYAYNETTQNIQDVYAKKLGTPIKYGEGVEIIHFETRHFLTLTDKRLGGFSPQNAAFYSDLAYE